VNIDLVDDLFFVISLDQTLCFDHGESVTQK
jgi:hypothetical protein